MFLFIGGYYSNVWASLPAMQETWLRSLGPILGSGRSPGRGHGNLLQYSCLETPMDTAWQAIVHEVSKSQT